MPNQTLEFDQLINTIVIPAAAQPTLRWKARRYQVTTTDAANSAYVKT